MRGGEEEEKKAELDCWPAHRGTHSEHLHRASCDIHVASVQDAPNSFLCPFLSSYSSTAFSQFLRLPVFTCTNTPASTVYDALEPGC